jgi:FtsH-binding integral membrane protein
VSFTLSSIVAQYNDVVISKAFLFTAIIVIISTVISMLYPDLVTSLINYLFFIIIVVLALSFTMWALFPLWFNVLDYIIVLTFSVMYGYSFIRAQDYPKTLDNAIDSAADLYLDIICLFIKLLSVTNKED